MPLELSNALKDTCGWSFSSRGMNNLFCNKFYTSVILTIIIIVLIMVIYPCKKGTPVYITFKLGFYILLATLGIMFIHDSVVHRMYERERMGGQTNAFIEALGGENNVAFANDKVKVEYRPVGGDGIIGDNTCDIRVGGDTEPKSNEEVFAMFGV